MKRALEYPYSKPGCSFVHRVGEVRELPAASDLDGLELAGRAALLAYGANAAPEALDRKLASLPDRSLPVLVAELEGFDVVYSAHVSPYGGVPATLWRCPGVRARVHVVYPDAEQMPLLAATEPNYELVRLGEVSCRVDGAGLLSELDAFESVHGPLRVEGEPIAVAAVPAAGRTLGAKTSPEILELVRSQVEPDATLEGFIATCIASGGITPLQPLASPR